MLKKQTALEKSRALLKRPMDRCEEDLIEYLKEKNQIEEAFKCGR